MNSEPEIDFIALGKIAVEAKWRLLAFGILFGAVMVATSFLFKPAFSAEILLLNSPAERRSGGVISSTGSSTAGLSALIGGSFNSDSNTQEALAVLRSRALIDDFVAEKDLLPVLFKDRWDAKSKQWKSESSWLYSTFSGKPTSGEAYDLFNKEIRQVEEDRKSGLVTLTIEWSNPLQAAEWATELVNRANTKLRSTAIERSEKSLDFLNEEIRKTNEVEVREAIYKLIDSQLKREMFAKVNEDYAFEVIDPATVPEKKIRPKRSLFALLGFIFGTTIGFALELRRKRF